MCEITIDGIDYPISCEVAELLRSVSVERDGQRAVVDAAKQVSAYMVDASLSIEAYSLFWDLAEALKELDKEI